MYYLFKMCMFISSFFPLYILFIILNMSIIYRIISGNYLYTDMIFLIFFFVLMCISIVIIYIVLNAGNTNTIKFNHIERPGDTIISYIFTYIVPILSVNINEFNTIIANVFLVIMMSILYLKLDLLYINPILTLIGLVPYRTENRIIISDIPFFKLSKIERLNGYAIGEGIFIARKKWNNMT